MRISFFLATVLSAALAVSATAAKKPAPATDTATTTPPPKKEEPKKTTYTLTGEVAAVTASSLTLKSTVTDEPDKKYAFTENTKILNGEKAANLADIKVGKKIGALLRKAKGDDQVLLVNVNGKEPVEKTDEKKTDKKPVTTSSDKPKPKKKSSNGNNNSAQ